VQNFKAETNKIRASSRRQIIKSLIRGEKLENIPTDSLISSSSLARQPMVGPGFLKKLWPFVSVEGDPLPIFDF